MTHGYENIAFQANVAPQKVLVFFEKKSKKGLI
jgi:hypothetical protein